MPHGYTSQEGLVVVRTWSVRSTSLNYRIQIRTCGKSEDYAQMPSDKKPKLEVKDRAQIQKEIARKELKLRAAEDKILALSDVIKHKSNFLKEKNAHEKAVRVAKARVSTHEEYYALDLARRPPDRGDDIRIYTKMDMSLWEYGQVRDWFNKKADPNFDPASVDSPPQSPVGSPEEGSYHQDDSRRFEVRRSTDKTFIGHGMGGRISSADEEMGHMVTVARDGGSYLRAWAPGHLGKVPG